MGGGGTASFRGICEGEDVAEEGDSERSCLPRSAGRGRVHAAQTLCHLWLASAAPREPYDSPMPDADSLPDQSQTRDCPDPSNARYSPPCATRARSPPVAVSSLPRTSTRSPYERSGAALVPIATSFAKIPVQYSEPRTVTTALLNVNGYANSGAVGEALARSPPFRRQPGFFMKPRRLPWLAARLPLIKERPPLCDSSHPNRQNFCDHKSVSDASSTLLSLHGDDPWVANCTSALTRFLRRREPARH